MTESGDLAVDDSKSGDESISLGSNEEKEDDDEPFNLPPAGGKTAGQHPIICQFMYGTRHLWTVVRNFTALWDLSLVTRCHVNIASPYNR